MLVTHHNTVPLPEYRDSMVLQDVGILPQYYTVSQTEDGGSMVLQNISILSHCHNSEDDDLNLHCCQNLKSCNPQICYHLHKN